MMIDGVVDDRDGDGDNSDTDEKYIAVHRVLEPILILMVPDECNFHHKCHVYEFI